MPNPKRHAHRRKGIPTQFPEAGMHLHMLEREHERTKTDGRHFHLFVIDGQFVITEEGGAHAHTFYGPDAPYTHDGEHFHRITLPDGTEVETEIDGFHGHELISASTLFDGTHTHRLRLPDGSTVQSVSATDMWRLMGSPDQEGNPKAPPASALAVLAPGALPEASDAEMPRHDPAGEPVAASKKIKRCRDSDKDPDKPDDEQVYCVWDDDEEKLLGRHGTLEDARGQLGAIEADKRAVDLEEAAAIAAVGAVGPQVYVAGDLAKRGVTTGAIDVLVEGGEGLARAVEARIVETAPADLAKRVRVRAYDDAVPETRIACASLRAEVTPPIRKREDAHDVDVNPREAEILCTRSGVAVVMAGRDGYDVWHVDVARSPLDPAEAIKSLTVEGGRDTRPLTQWNPAKFSRARPEGEPISGALVEHGLHVGGYELFVSKSALGAGVLRVRPADGGWVAKYDPGGAPAVLARSAVEAGVVPPAGHSALPESLEKVVPADLRYWEAQGSEVQTRRDTLVLQGVLDAGSVLAVDGELCKVRSDLYVADEPDEALAWDEALAVVVGDATIASPTVADTWTEDLAKCAVEADVVVVSAPTADMSPWDVVKAAREVGGKAHYLAECTDTPEAREALSAVGPLFKLRAGGAGGRLFAASFALDRTDLVEWVEPPAVGKRAAVEERAQYAVTKADDGARRLVLRSDRGCVRYQVVSAGEDEIQVLAGAAADDEIEAGAGFTVEARGVAKLHLADDVTVLDIPDGPLAGVWHASPEGDRVAVLRRVRKSGGVDAVKRLVDRAWTAHLPVLKSDEEERFVFGVVLEPDGVDAQDDTISPEDVRRAAHKFMEEAQNIGFMHGRMVNDRVRILESYVAPVKFKVDGTTVKKGTWLLGVRVADDDLWSSVKSGELGGFSIGGTAVRQPEPDQ